MVQRYGIPAEAVNKPYAVKVTAHRHLGAAQLLDATTRSSAEWCVGRPSRTSATAYEHWSLACSVCAACSVLGSRAAGRTVAWMAYLIFSLIVDGSSRLIGAEEDRLMIRGPYR